LGEFHGFSILAAPHVVARHVTLSLTGVPSDSTMVFDLEAVGRSNIVARLENRLKELPALRERDRAEIERIHFEISRAREELAKPFRHAQLLRDKRAALSELDERIRREVQPQVPPMSSGLSQVPSGPEGEKRSAALMATVVTDAPRSDSETRVRLERLEHEFQKPVQRIPDAGAVRGRLMRVEPEDGGCWRAVVVTDRAIYVLSGFPRATEKLQGSEVAVTRTPAGIRLTPQREPRVELER
jgi:hypothetical protein